MRYQRTQIYLDPEDHRHLTEEAARRGMSLAALVREIASSHVREKAPSYGAKSFDSIIAIVGEGPPSDIAGHTDEYLADAADLLYWKKMGRRGPEPESHRDRWERERAAKKTGRPAGTKRRRKQ